MVTSWKNIALFLLTLTVLVCCLLILRVFLAAIVGALVLAVATQPLHRWLRKTLASPTAAASVAIFLVAIGIILPGIFLVRVLGQYVVAAGTALSNGSVEAAVQQAVNHHPQLAALLQQGSRFLTWNNAAERAGAFLSAHAISLLSNSIGAITQTIVMLFLLFFLYRDNTAALRALYSMLPMERKEALDLVTSVEVTIRAAFLGHLAVAAIQGIVAAIVFALLRVTGAAPLGILTALAAMVPTFGAYVVWLPVAVYLGLAGRWLPAILLIAIGSLVISTLDNLLYPLLVGAQLRQHPAIILLALLGGVWMFGIAGLVLGPVLFSMAMALLHIWQARNQQAGEALPRPG